MFADWQATLEQESNVDWESHFILTQPLCVPINMLPEQKSTAEAEAEALGRSRGGLTTKIHLRCEGKGKLITFLLTPGQESDIDLVEKRMEQGCVHRTIGHPRLRPRRLVADKGYTSKAFRHYLRRRDIRYTLPRRRNEHHKGAFGKQIYRKRNIVERLICRLKQFHRIATRYEKRAANFAAMISLASLFISSKKSLGGKRCSSGFVPN